MSESIRDPQEELPALSLPYILDVKKRDDLRLSASNRSTIGQELQGAIQALKSLRNGDVRAALKQGGLSTLDFLEREIETLTDLVRHPGEAARELLGSRPSVILGALTLYGAVHTGMNAEAHIAKLNEKVGPYVQAAYERQSAKEGMLKQIPANDDTYEIRSESTRSEEPDVQPRRPGAAPPRP